MLAFVLAGLFTGVLIPYITTGWQDHQKEVELKTSIVSDISRSATTTVVAIQSKEYLGQGGKPYVGSYNNWEIASEQIGSQLRSYFSSEAQQHVAKDWENYADLVDQFFALSDCSFSALATRPEDFGNLRQQVLRLASLDMTSLGDATLRRIQDPVDHGMVALAKWKGWEILALCPVTARGEVMRVQGQEELIKGSPYEEYWWQLRGFVLAEKDVVTREVLKFDMPVYTHFPPLP